jgi:hypothetical protein
MIEYRITKYDPAFRDSGRYTRDEWTSVSDVGRSFGGMVLVREEYNRVEDAYVAAALAFLDEACVPALTVAGLEERRGRSSIADGDQLDPTQLAEALRQLLREELWCRLECEEAFLHVGYDFEMYLGVPRQCPVAEDEARRLRLFVELVLSPYRARG